MNTDKEYKYIHVHSKYLTLPSSNELSFKIHVQDVIKNCRNIALPMIGQNFIKGKNNRFLWLEIIQSGTADPIFAVKGIEIPAGYYTNAELSTVFYEEVGINQAGSSLQVGDSTPLTFNTTTSKFTLTFDSTSNNPKRYIALVWDSNNEKTSNWERLGFSAHEGEDQQVLDVRGINMVADEKGLDSEKATAEGKGVFAVPTGEGLELHTIKPILATIVAGISGLVESPEDVYPYVHKINTGSAVSMIAKRVSLNDNISGFFVKSYLTTNASYETNRNLLHNTVQATNVLAWIPNMASKFEYLHHYVDNLNWCKLNSTDLQNIHLELMDESGKTMSLEEMPQFIINLIVEVEPMAAAYSIEYMKKQHEDAYKRAHPIQ